MTLNKTNQILIILSFIISCEENIAPIVTNPVSTSPEKEMGLYGSYNEKNEIKLYWLDYYGCNLYDISIPEFGYSITTENQTNYFLNDLNYNPGYCFTAYVSCSNNQDYQDSLVLQTKPITPISNITIHVEAGGYDDSLTFVHSSDSDIITWDFYRFEFNQNDASTHPHYFDVSNSASEWEKDEAPSGWWGDAGWGTNKQNYYIYKKENLDESFCYLIKITDSQNYTRNSYIKCSDNYTRNANNPVEITTISDNLQKRIVIEWEEYTDPDFYQYIIWKSEYKNIPENSRTQLATIIEREQTTYHDRYNIGDGQRWYYMIEVQNEYGKSEFSEIKSGLSRP